MQLLNNSTSNATWNLEKLPISSVMGLCFVLGITGNVAVVLVIYRHFKKDNFTLQLMLNLAASDILCLITLPLWIYDVMFGWTIGHTFCRFSLFLVYCSIFASVMTVTLMSVQRYLLVLYPLKWAKLGRRGERALLLTLWAVACVLTGLLHTVAEENVSEDGAMTCRNTMKSNAGGSVMVLFEVLLGFAAPFSILVTSYFCLHKKVNQTAFFRDQRMTRMVTSIVVTFFLFYIPYHLVNLLYFFAISLKSSYPDVSQKLFDFYKSSRDYVDSLAFINSCLDPFLYVFAFRSLRQSAEQPERVEDGQTTDV